MHDAALQAVVLGLWCQQDGVMFTKNWTGERNAMPIQFPLHLFSLMIPEQGVLASTFFMSIVKKSLVEEPLLA